MNTGMQDAFNLAWKLALVVLKTCDEHLLDSYSPERSAVGDEVLKSAARLTAVGITKSRGPSSSERCRSRDAWAKASPACLCRQYVGGHDWLSKESTKWSLARRSGTKAR